VSLLTRLLTGAGLATLGVAGLYKLALRQPQAPLDGVVSPPGVKTDVEIVRDHAGVPHVYAGLAHDLYYSLGYLHAQDRLWHMELNRRVGQGRLSEIFGEPTVTFDRLMRRLGLAHVARAEAMALDPEAGLALEGYAAGVNGFLAAHQYRLPLECRILRFRPEPWEPADSLVCGKLLSWLLSSNWDTEWFRARLVDRLGPEAAARVDLGYPKGHPITIEPGLSYAGFSGTLVDEFQAIQRDLGLLTGGMSNAWAVSPAKSATGSALLASDPHLAPQMPSIWYEAHLCGDGLDVVGVTMPGVPFVLIGHNQQIAWGITASIVDTQDLFVERTSPDQPGQYDTPTGWQPLVYRSEEIRVRGHPAVIREEIAETRHGPVLTPLLNGESRLLAVQSPLLLPGHAARGALRLNRAQNWDEFRSALADWDLAVNVVYADRDGNIGYQLCGNLPRRERGSGLLPAPGWDSRYDWQGYLPFDELPNVYNPPCGYVVSANNRIVGDDFPHRLSWDWCDGFRAGRIESELRAREKLTLDDFAALQSDFYSDAARQIVETIRDLVPPAGNPIATRALEYLRRWDYRLTAGSVAAAIYSVLRRQLLRNVFASRLGSLVGSFTGIGAADGIAGNLYPARASGFLIQLLRRADPEWLAGDPAFQDWDDLKWRSLVDAVDELRSRFGDDMETWTWGRLHGVTFDHPFGRVKLLRRLFSRGPYPIGGDGDTPHQSASTGGSYGADGYIPSYRQLVDLGNFANSRSIHTTGQSGHPGSPHYDDFIPLWLSGQYHPTLYDRIQILDDLEHMLVLRPR
jgi:penicillin G amidase